MNQREICSTEDLHHALREIWHGYFLFRGEDSASYTLYPKYGRFQARDARNNMAKEQSVLAEFKRRATPFIQHIPENDWEWLALAQHFGLATRLLDWTENPLIAAYFATYKPTIEGDRVIYVLDRNKFKYADLGVSPFEIQEVVLYSPKHISPRISSQSGVFTAHSSPSQVLGDDRLEKWLIKDDCVIELRTTLLSYGINEAFIFPDLDGLARYLNHLFVWGVIQ